LREELQRRAARRARRYSLRETVRAYIELYENISSGGRTMKRKPHPNSAEARL
jgi:hypothetical protein